MSTLPLLSKTRGTDDVVRSQRARVTECVRHRIEDLHAIAIRDQNLSVTQAGYPGTSARRSSRNNWCRYGAGLTERPALRIEQLGCGKSVGQKNPAIFECHRAREASGAVMADAPTKAFMRGS